MYDNTAHPIKNKNKNAKRPIDDIIIKDMIMDKINVLTLSVIDQASWARPNTLQIKKNPVAINIKSVITTSYNLIGSFKTNFSSIMTHLRLMNTIRRGLITA